MSTKTITAVAEKGGVGKTTFIIQLATATAAAGYRVLVVDLDKQANLSSFMLGTREVYALPQHFTIAAILDHEFDPLPEEVVHPTQFDNLWVIPSNKILHGLMKPEQDWREENATSLRDFIDEVDDYFDFVFVDTHPCVDTLPTWVGLRASDYIFTPVEPEQFSAHSTVAAKSRIEHAKRVNPNLIFVGFFINKFNKSRKLHREIRDELVAVHGNLVFEGVLGNYTEIPTAIRERRSLNIDSTANEQMLCYLAQIMNRMSLLTQAQQKGGT